MKAYDHPELRKVRPWQNLAIRYRKLWSENRDDSLHRFLDTLGVPRSAYGFENATDGAWARIAHYIEHLKGNKPLILPRR